MKLIPLSQQGKNKGKYFAQVDDDNYDWLSQWNWNVINGHNTYYAVTSEYRNGKQKRIWMHRLVLGITNPNMFTDHIDHNGLNNQKCNLRVASKKENNQNRKAKKSGGSKYLGVSLGAGTNKYTSRVTGITKISPRKAVWRAAIRIDKKLINLGSFNLSDEEQAARAYDEAAKKYFGKFANLNFPTT